MRFVWPHDRRKWPGTTLVEVNRQHYENMEAAIQYIEDLTGKLEKMKHYVNVSAIWRSNHKFEFDSIHKAQEFIDKVNSGGDEGLQAIIDEGDVHSSNAELVDFEAN